MSIFDLADQQLVILQSEFPSIFS